LSINETVLRREAIDRGGSSRLKKMSKVIVARRICDTKVETSISDMTEMNIASAIPSTAPF
jgi:hypothetical protein